MDAVISPLIARPIFISLPFLFIQLTLRTLSHHFIHIVQFGLVLVRFHEHHEIHTLQTGSKKEYKKIHENIFFKTLSPLDRIALKHVSIYTYGYLSVCAWFFLVFAHTFSYTYEYINFQYAFSPKKPKSALQMVYTHQHAYTQRNRYAHIICIE